MVCEVERKYRLSRIVAKQTNFNWGNVQYAQYAQHASIKD